MYETRLQLGALCDTIAKQLSHTKVDKKTLKVWDRYADAITLLSIHGLLSESEAHKARARLVNKHIRKTLAKPIS